MAVRIDVLLLLALVVSIPLPATADEIRVPADQPTIQDGIDAARPGDTVIISSGTYIGPDNRDLDFKGKAITVRSEDGAETCIIDCQGEGFGFIFQDGEGQNSVLEGVTIRDGYTSDWTIGAAITCITASPTIRDNIIEECHEAYRVLYCVQGASPVIEHNIIRNCTGLDLTALMCEHDSSPLITDNVITGMKWSRDGYVGLVMRYRSSPTVINNLIHGNEFCHGAIIHIWYDSSPLLINNTVAGNTRPACPSYIVNIGEGCSPLLVNCIIWNHTNSLFDDYGDPIIRYCDIRNRTDMGPGCIDANPLFVAGPLGNYYLSQQDAGQEADSPCLDAGDPGTSSPGGTTRTDDRPDTGIPDMGYHYSSYASVCDLDGSGRVDGIDLSIIGSAFGAEDGDPRYLASADFDRNGVIDGDDLVIFSFYFGATV